MIRDVAAESMRDDTIGIYIHIPFCVRKCLYCDFNSQVPASEDAYFFYTDALLREIASSKELLKKRRLDSIYIGGGTPSTLPSHCLRRIFEGISDVIDIEDDTEITIEANPGTVGEYKIRDYVSLGINRVSLGGQSAIDDELRALGRAHTAKDLLLAYDKLYWGGIDNISIDIMTSIPYQTRKSLIKTLDTVTGLHPKHISAYSLTIEKGTPFYEKYKYKTLDLPSEDESYFIYKLTQEYLASGGYKRYEISNYANDPDYRCRHNIRYWDRGDYIGFGVSASSLIGDHRFTNTSDLTGYVSAPGRDRSEDMILKTKDEMAEFMFLGLRKVEGVRLSDFYDCFGKDIRDVYGEIMQGHIEAELAVIEGGESEERFMLTDRGMDVANFVMKDYL